MRLLALSDTHIGQPGWDGFGKKVFSRALKMAQEETPDVVLFCGDLVTEGQKLNVTEGLRLLKEIPAKKRLWVAGNNDLEPYFGRAPIQEYADVLQTFASCYDVHLLDQEPVIIGDTAFVGNFGGWDLSLWREPAQKTPEWPSTYEELFEGVDEWHQKNVGLGVRELFNLFQKRLRRHLKQVEGHRIVLTTHTVPTKEMILYGHSPRFDFKNAAIGWDDEMTGKPLHTSYPGVILQFCGHTHRSETLHRVGCSPLINISGEDQPRWFDV